MEMVIWKALKERDKRWKHAKFAGLNFSLKADFMSFDSRGHLANLLPAKIIEENDTLSFPYV